jgi:HEAT repeat protein
MKEIKTMKNQMIIASVILAAGLAPAATTNQTAIDTIETALQSKNVEIRKDAVEALGIAGPKYVWGLRQSLDDKAPEVRFAAAKALYEMNDPAGEQALLGVLNGDSKTSSGFMAQQGREAARTVQSPKSLAIATAKGAALLSPVPGASLGVSMTVKAISKHGADRAATALLLGKANSPEVIAALENALTDKDPAVRAAAIQAIALSGNPELAKDAQSLMNDKNRTVRLRAAAAWLRLTSIESADAE